MGVQFPRMRIPTREEGKKMFLKLKKYTSFALIFTLLLSRVLFVSPAVFAQGVPTVPPPPAVNSAPPPPPPPNSVPAMPSIQSFPTVAPPPTNVPAPTIPSQPTNTVLPAVAPPLAGESIATNAPLSSPTPSPTGEGGSSTISPTGTSDTGSSSSVNDPANILTGAGSYNEAIEKVDQKLEVMNQNLAEMQNKIDAVSNSGSNFANLNTLSGQVSTGDSVSSVNLLNKLNSNMTGVGGFSVFNIYDTYLGDIKFQFADNGTTGGFSTASGTVSKNAVTGPASNNNAAAENSFTVKGANGNDAQLTNDIVLQAVTGNNTASFNTGDGVIKTGNATAVGNVVNMANSNISASQWLWGVVNIFGTLVGNIILPSDSGTTANQTGSPAVLTANENTGALSTNTATYTNTSDAQFETSNSSDIVSTVDASANSGNNTSSINTGGGFVHTGNTDTTVSISTIANTNTVKEDNTVWMIIVNEAGKWVGYIIGSPWGATSASNALPVSQTATGGGIQTYNTGTGALSDNNASFTNSDQTTVTSANSAAIANNIIVSSDTGNNEASVNTGAGVIQTGDAKSSLNLVNMANTNVVAKKFIAILVNVLGAWVGNAITPNAQNTTTNTTSEANTSSVPTPTPTAYQVPAFTEASSNVGNAGYVQEAPEDTTATQPASQQFPALVYYSYPQDTYTYVYETYPREYMQAVSTVNQQRQYVVTKKNTYKQMGVAPSQGDLGVAKQFKRGLFISPAFAKATEGSSIAAVLLSGASLKVSEKWLWVIPVALFIFFIRRRKKYDFSHYINALFEVIL